MLAIRGATTIAADEPQQIREAVAQLLCEIADLTVLDLNRPQAVDSSTFLSMGRATPFDGWAVTAGVDKTICSGNLVYTAASRNVNKTSIPPCQEDYV